MRLSPAFSSCLLFAQAAFGASAQEKVEAVASILDSTVHDWRFASGEIPGAGSPDFDDSTWQAVDIGHKWWPSDSTCWFRKRIAIPERISGISVAGSTVRLKLGVDNGAKVYVNGTFKQQFIWANGDVLIAENARPGDVVCVAINGINGPGFGSLYKADLVSSAGERMVEPLRAFLETCKRALTDGVYQPQDDARHWEALVNKARQELDLMAYNAADERAFLQSLERARDALLEDQKEFEAVLRRTEERLDRLTKLLARGRSKGLQLAYRGVEARTIESFLQYARDDMADEEVGHKFRAINIARFLDTLCDSALDKTAATLDNPTLDLRVPVYATKRTPIRDGAFMQEGRPLFFTGVGHFDQVRRDTPILTQYGLNLIQFEIGAASVLPTEDTVDPAAVRERVVRALDVAAEHDVAVNLLISPHYFPQWALTRNPKLAECGMGFIKYCIDAPDAPEVFAKFLDVLMPMVARHPALHSICLSNEPQYTGKCGYSQNQFHAWLEREHGSIEVLNAAYGAQYQAFSDVPIPVDASNYALLFDWNRFNQDRFHEFHRFLRDIIRKHDPDLPVHAKVMSQAFRDPDHFAAGINHEDFNRLGDIAGNDCWQFFNGEQEEAELLAWPTMVEYLQEWRTMAMNYTLQHCTAPANPIFNSEDHVVHDRDGRFVPAAHIRTAYWTQALHGQGASTTWVWDRDQGGDMAENILTRPNCVLALGTIALDLNRLGSEVAALQHAKSDMAILYAYSSLLPSEDYIQDAGAAFEGAYFTDATCDFVTERRVAAGKLNDYKLVVVPRASHAPEAVVRAFQEFIASGGTVMTVGACFTHDEHGRPRASGLSPASSGRLVAYPDPLTPHAYRDILSGLMDTAGCERPVRMHGAQGESVWGVNLRAVPYNGKLLVSLVNFLRTPQRVQLETAGNSVKHAVNLFDNATVRFPLTLEPLDPVLLSIEPRPEGTHSEAVPRKSAG